MKRTAGIVLVLLLQVALTACLAGPADVVVPALTAGSEAEYEIRGTPHNFVAWPFIGAEDPETGESLFPTEGGRFSVSVGQPVAVLGPNGGRTEGVYRFDYRFTDGEDRSYDLGWEYMTQASGRLVQVEPWLVTWPGAPGRTVVNDTGWSHGHADVLHGTLFAGKTLTDGSLDVRLFPWKAHPLYRYYEEPARFEVEVRNGVAHVTLSAKTLETTNILRLESTWDDSCPFPRQVNAVGVPSRVFEAIRISCSSGPAGTPITLSEPHPEIQEANPGLSDRPDYGLSPADLRVTIQGFSVQAAWSAVEASEAYREHCVPSCKVGSVRWQERLETMGIAGIPVMQHTVYAWAFEVYGASGALRALEGRSVDGAVRTGEVDPWTWPEKNRNRPLGDASRALDLEVVVEAGRLAFPDHPLEIKWWSYEPEMLPDPELGPWMLGTAAPRTSSGDSFASGGVSFWFQLYSGGKLANYIGPIQLEQS